MTGSFSSGPLCPSAVQCMCILQRPSYGAVLEASQAVWQMRPCLLSMCMTKCARDSYARDEQERAASDNNDYAKAFCNCCGTLGWVDEGVQ